MASEATPTRLIKQREVCSRTTMSRTAVWKRLKAGTFPKPITLGDGKRIAWVEKEVDDWIAARIAERRAA